VLDGLEVLEILEMNVEEEEAEEEVDVDI